MQNEKTGPLLWSIKEAPPSIKPRPPAPFTTREFRGMLDQCIHCGLCLQNCPTYVVTGMETDAPRGRIHLMRAVADARIPIEGAFRKHLEQCTACLSCETACPSGVRYGHLMDTVRLALAESTRPGVTERAVRWAGLRQGLPHLGRLRTVAQVFRIYERVGLQSLVRRANVLPRRLKAMEAILPPLAAAQSDYSRPAPAIGAKRGTVAFFHGCLQEAFLGRVNAATVRVLQRNGYEVHFPQRQTCCGAAQLHVGEQEFARQLARHNIDAFGTDGFDAIVNNAGGCGALLKEYADLLRGDPAYAERARAFAAKVQDITEFLATHLTRPPRGAVMARVTYSDSCHLRNAQKILRPPRDLIAQVPGTQFIELASPDRCCGSAGVYNITHPELADDILDVRMADIAATGADTIVVTNTGCHMQLIYGARRAGLKARVIHLVELLDESYRAEVS